MIDDIIEGIIDIIKKNLIAKTYLEETAVVGSDLIKVDNTFFFNVDEEIILIDELYNDPAHIHYHQFEYARIKDILDTNTIQLHDPLEGEWKKSDSGFIQKTIGHSPLYCDRIYYGDRQVIPAEDIAITVDPTTLSNEWLYIGGGDGLSREYKANITVYGKQADTETGLKIITKYADNIHTLLNSNIHLDINNVESRLEQSVSSGKEVIIKDTPRNRENFFITKDVEIRDCVEYYLQDNGKAQGAFEIADINYNGGNMHLIFDRKIENDFLTNDFAHIRKQGRYIYDSRVDGIEYGYIQKGSAYLRGAQLSWFGKEVGNCCRNGKPLVTCSQISKGVDCFEKKI